MLMMSAWWPETAMLSIWMSLSARRPMVYRSFSSSYWASSWPSNVSTNLPMATPLSDSSSHSAPLAPRRSREPVRQPVEEPPLGFERLERLDQDHGDVVTSAVVTGQLDQLLGCRLKVSTKCLKG